LKVALKLLVVLTLLSAHFVWAAPKQITLNYQATRNGKPFANIVENYQQSGEAYKLESVTEGVGLAALFGKRVLKSEGVVTEEGLVPKHFEQHQGDNEKKSVYADFDWQKNQLSMKSKGNLTSEALSKGTQDLLSFSYQWMFTSPILDEMTLAVTTGKKIRSYSYKVIERDVNLAVEAGQFKSLHLVSANPDGKGNEKEFWLAIDRFYLPIKIIQRDENGNVIEQTVTSMQMAEH
jgi:hypothetical protein